MKKVLYNGKEIFSNEKSSVAIGVILTAVLLIVSMTVGYNLRARQIEEAQARIKEERQVAYSEFLDLLYKYENMTDDVQVNRDL